MMAIMGAAAMREKDRRRPVAAETPKTLYLEPERSCKKDERGGVLSRDDRNAFELNVQY